MSFVHLHTHSFFSFLDGTVPLSKLVERVHTLGMPAVALTDRNGLYGAIEFYQHCKDFGIKPIIGSQVILTDSSSLVLLVKNPEGYRNLCRIITQSHLRGGHLNFECELDDIIGQKEGLVVLSGGKEGLISRLLINRNYEESKRICQRMKFCFGADFYLELQHFMSWDNFLNQKISELAKECNVPIVATNDVHMLSPDEMPLRQVLRAISENTLRDKIRTTGFKEQYLKSSQQMMRLFQDFPEAIRNSETIAESCQFEFSLGKPIFPVMKLPAGETNFTHLKKLCEHGMMCCYESRTPQIEERISYELRTIDSLGFTDYFLIVKDIVDFCRQEGIPCVGRGSAGGSIVSYVLGITFADPVRFNLYFERFLNPERTDAPDIDLDICWKNRDRVIEFVHEKYGYDQTAMICTFNTFQSRASIREVARVFGLPDEEIGPLTREFPYMAKSDNLEESFATIPGLKRRRLSQTYHDIITISMKLANFPRHLSIHAGGVIIAPAEITNYTPLEVAGKGIHISQYDMYSVERLGLVKMDLLGVRSLSIITECLESARKSLVGFQAAGNLDDTKFSFLERTEKLSPLDMRIIPENDPETIKLIRSGDTLGCFQLESPLVRGVLRKMQTDCIEDAVVAVAVIRPGVGDSVLKDDYILRRGGVKKPEYVHPILEPVIGDTHGVTIYQEQILLIAQAVAGFSLAQADTLRRAMTKGRDDKDLMFSLKAAFITGAIDKGLTEGAAAKCWEFIRRFSGFGFNKAHAATYGILAYQTAFLKRYFPVDYMTAVLNNHGGFYSKAVYVEECRRMGIKILPPDINCSDDTFRKEEESIRVGFYPIFELTERTKENIIRERNASPFADLYDFVQRTRAGQKETEHLIRCGALRSLHPSEPLLLMKAQAYFKNGCSKAVAEYVTTGLNPPAYSPKQRIIAELDLLGFSVDFHPLALYDGRIPWEQMVSSLEMEANKNKYIQFTGWYVTSRLQQTVKGDYMKFLSLEDKYGVCEVIFFPEVYERYAEILQGLGPFTVSGKVQSRLKGEANLIAERVIRWERPKDLATEQLIAGQLDMFSESRVDRDTISSEISRRKTITHRRAWRSPKQVRGSSRIILFPLELSGGLFESSIEAFSCLLDP
jgi:DNA-directed DNA polymerase III PolC